MTLARALLFAAALAAVVASPSQPTLAEPAAPADEVPTAESLTGELAAHLDGLPNGLQDKAHVLARELAADWRREAGSSDEAASVLSILREDLAKDLKGRSPKERLDVLRGEVYERRAGALGVRSFKLGRAVVDGTIEEDKAHVRAKALQSELSALRPLVETIEDRDIARPIERELQAVKLEILHALAGGAMSGRLSRYAKDEDKDADDAPTVR